MSTPARASVIILAWNGIKYLGDCIEAVLALDYSSLEIIVVDNGSTDGSADLIAERFPLVRLIRNEHNLGFAAGCNVGLRAATGDVLVLLNQDTEVHSAWLATLVAVFQDPSVGIAGCKALYPDGSIQHAGGFIYGPRAETEHVGRRESDDGRFDAQCDADFVTGAALAISRAALARVGLLDEGFYPAYYEDTDWCYTAREVGFRVVYAPAARLTHHETPTAQRESHEHKYALHRGRMRFVFKHWTLERLQQEFVPAERAWAASLGRTVEMMAARRAYLATMLEVGPIAAFRTRPDGVAHGQDPTEVALTLLRLLADLRATCVTREATEQKAVLLQRYEMFKELWERQAFQKPMFISKLPLLGPRIVALSQLSRALRQQVVYNVRLGEMLTLMMQWNAELERDVAENMREINELTECLASLRRT
jgi:GT2 family glycosyltransferase